MAFEDAATLADALALSGNAGTVSENLSKWESHRRKRIAKIVAFTARGGNMRKATSSPLQQIVKEWVMWLFFWWSGKDGGLQWIYSYRIEDAMKEIKA